MKTSIYRYIILVVFICNTTLLLSQIVSTASFSIDSVQIGDPVTVEINITVPSNLKIKSLDFSNYKNVENLIFLQDTNRLEKIADIEILDFGNWKHENLDDPIDFSKLQINMVNGNQVIQNTITLAIYNTGVFGISGPMVSTEGDATILPTSPKTIQVLLPIKLTQQDTLDINPIKDIMYEKADISDFLIYLYILLALGIMVLIGYFFSKRKKNKIEVTIPEPIIILPPDEKALKALQLLRDEQLWQQGKIKEYQSGLTDIIRTYLEDRYDIKAPEMTSDEIANALHHVDFDIKYTSVLQEILQVADLVKFAKATPGDDIHSKFMDKAVEFVLNTKPLSQDLKTEEKL